MKRIRSLVLNGRRWRVVWRRLPDDWGTCDLCNTIEIDVRIDDVTTATEIILHEVLHGRFPEWDEDAIETLSRELTTILNRAELLADDD